MDKRTKSGGLLLLSIAIVGVGVIVYLFAAKILHF